MKRMFLILMEVIILLTLGACDNNETSKETLSSEVERTEDEQENTKQWSISENHQEASVTGTYWLDEIAYPKEGYISSMEVKGELALVVVTNFSDNGAEDYSVVLYDLSKAQIAWEMHIGADYAEAGFLSDGSVCLYRESQENIAVYEKDGNLRFSYSDISYGGNVYADSDEGLWFIADGKLQCLREGEREEWELNLYGNVPTIASVENGEVLYSYWLEDSEVASYDTVTGEEKWFAQMEGFKAGSGLLYKTEDNNFYYSPDGEKIYSITLPVGSSITGAAVSDGKILIRNMDKSFLYDLQTQSIEKIQTGECQPGIIAGQQEGFLFRYMDAKGDRICYFENVTVTGEVVQLTEVKFTSEQLSNREKAEALYEKYGIFVSWLPVSGGEMVANQYYKSVNDQDDAEISEFLDALEAALSVFPQDMFRIIMKGKVSAIYIDSSNGLVSELPDSLDAAGAVVYDLEDAIGMTFDSSENAMVEINGRTAHELCHVLEKAICKEQPEEDILKGWNQLNPEGFSYLENFSNYWSSREFVFDYYSTDYENYYFVTPYGKTNAQEDRATVFKEMCYPYVTMFEGSHIYAKAEYLTNLLKEYYPELYENGNPIWMNYKN